MNNHIAGGGLRPVLPDHRTQRPGRRQVLRPAVPAVLQVRPPKEGGLRVQGNLGDSRKEEVRRGRTRRRIQ